MWRCVVLLVVGCSRILGIHDLDEAPPDAPMADMPVPCLGDNFDDDSLDTSFWQIENPSSAATIDETGGQIVITVAPSAANYGTLRSAGRHDLRDSAAQLEVVQAASQAGWVENGLELQFDGANKYHMAWGVGNLELRTTIAGNTTGATVPYVAAERFWRIKHSQTTVTFETSTDGAQWMIRRTAPPLAVEPSSVLIQVFAGAWGAGNATPGAAKYDNFRIVTAECP